jgi:hypothetical protein
MMQLSFYSYALQLEFSRACHKVVIFSYYDRVNLKLMLLMIDQKILLKSWLSAYTRQHDVTLSSSNVAEVMGIRYGCFDIIVEVDSENYVYFHVRLMPVPTIDQLSFFQRLLHLNTLCIQTAGATLAVDPEEPHVLLCMRQALGMMDEHSFIALFSSFILHTEKLHALLSTDHYSQNHIDRFSIKECKHDTLAINFQLN